MLLRTPVILKYLREFSSRYLLPLGFNPYPAWYTVDISYDIASLRGDAYSHYYFRKTLPAFIPNPPSVGANIRAPRYYRKICFRELRNLTRYSATHFSTSLSTSGESIHRNGGFSEEVVCNVFAISESRSPRPPMTFLRPLIGLCYFPRCPI